MKEASDFPRNASFLKRFALALFGISVMGSGVALTAASNMGVSPISSVPYVVSFSFNFAFTANVSLFRNGCNCPRSLGSVFASI